MLSICSAVMTESERLSTKELEKHGHSAAVVDYQAKTPLLLPVPKHGTKAEGNMQTVPVKEAAASEAADTGIKAAKAAEVSKPVVASAEVEQAVAAELVKGAIHRVLASLTAESDATTASSEDGGADGGAEAPVRQARTGGGGKKKKNGRAKKGGKRK